MYSEAYDAWVSLFTDDVAKIWSSEVGELQKLAMLFYTLKKEFKSVETQIESKMQTFHQQLTFEGNSKMESGVCSGRSVKNGNKTPVKSKEKLLNTSMEIKDLEKSPKIGRNMPRLKKFQPPLFAFDKIMKKEENNQSLIDESRILEDTVIESTPPKIVKNIPVRKPRKRLKILNHSSGNNSTLTQMLSALKNDATKIEKENSKYLEKLPISASQETFVDENLLQNIKQNKVLMKKSSPDYVHKMDPVRGKKRKELQGWACNDCKQYYEALNLPFEELQKMMQRCSKHKSKFAPAYETPAAYLAMDTTNSETDECNSLILPLN